MIGKKLALHNLVKKKQKEFNYIENELLNIVVNIQWAKSRFIYDG